MQTQKINNPTNDSLQVTCKLFQFRQLTHSARAFMTDPSPTPLPLPPWTTCVSSTSNELFLCANVGLTPLNLLIALPVSSLSQLICLHAEHVKWFDFNFPDSELVSISCHGLLPCLLLYAHTHTLAHSSEWVGNIWDNVAYAQQYCLISGRHKILRLWA